MSRRNFPILGYTSRTTVMLDLDDIGYREAKYWAFKICKKFQLKGFDIIQSSQRHYHIVFNRKLPYENVVSIIANVCLETKSQSLTTWFLLQCHKKEFTLRISAKGTSPSPKIVFQYGRQDKEIKEFLQYRRMIKNKLQHISKFEPLINPITDKWIGT